MFSYTKENETSRLMRNKTEKKFNTCFRDVVQKRAKNHQVRDKILYIKGKMHFKWIIMNSDEGKLTVKTD
jgi:hypothetical protein